MILEFDGLDSLWEDNVNWDTLNPQQDEEYDEDGNIDEINECIYTPVQHNPNTFTPLYAGDLIPLNEIHAYDSENNEKLQHDTLKILLANHLQIMYREGKVRWPKHRKEILDNYLVNELVRENLPGAGDL
jgi:hypothetical protein